MAATLFELAGREISRLLDPVLGAVHNPHALERLLAELGAQPDALGSDRDKLMAVLTAVAGLQEQAAALTAQSSPSLQALAELLDLCDQAVAGLRALDGLGAANGVFAELGADLVAYLLADYLDHWHPLAQRLAVLATLIEPSHEQEAGLPAVRDDMVLRDAVRFDRFRFGRLVDLVRDPVATLRAEYGTVSGTIEEARKLEQRLFPRLQRVLRILGVPCRYGFDPDAAPGLGEAAPFLEHALIVYLDDVLAGAPVEAGLILNISPADRGDLGLVVSPFGTLTTTKQAGAWLVDTSLTGDVEVLAYGRHGLTLLADTATAQVQAAVSATLPLLEDRPAFVLGAPTGSRLEIAGARIALETSLSEAQQSLALAADIPSAAIVIAPGDGDSFLASVLPAEGLRVDFDLGVGWSSDKGWTLHGSAGLEAAIAVDRSVAGITLSTLYLSLQAQDDRLVSEISASMGASIGPVQAVVERMGLRAVLAFPENGGNIGVADLAFGFKPPSGLGLAIDASSVVGGGYLFFDPDKGEYAGVLQLAIADTINVKAFGLLNTRLPDGTTGYSLVVFITAEDFQPIQLGMGFKLMGIGGMLAINRTFDEAAMREGLRNDTLATLLFPRDPVRNAPEILRNLAIVFPAKPGSYLFGPMAKIGWATPTLIQMDLALILEFGSRRRLIVLGRISSILPSRDKDLVRLNMDALGVFDFDVGTVSLDAVLVDSRLLQKFVLTGSMAMRACLVPGPRAGFALSVGGMNPHFSPPASMPRLDRITINLTSGDNPRFTCEAYFAVTSNTIQFGSRSTLYAGAYGFSIQGDVGFDVLVQLLPFRFLADFHAAIQLKRGSRNLFKVEVAGALEGPRPLRVSAKASFEILWCDFSIRFDKTLIAGERPELPPAVNALEELERALARPESWNTDLPAARRHGVTMRKLAADAPLALDPLGELTVRQTVLPLNTNRDMDVFGGAPLSGARRFTITAATLDRETLSVHAARDLFAPAQFFALSDDDKLASPSFEEMDSGVVFGSDRIGFDESVGQRVDAPLEYETITIDAAGVEAPAQPYTLEANRLQQHARFASVAKAAVRNTGLARFRNAAAVPVVDVAPERWVVASTADLNLLASPTAAGVSWGDARVALEDLRRSHAGDATRWQLVPAHELEF